MKKIWIGIDTGGTFTDLVLCELTAGRYSYHKVPTTTGDPAKAVLDGIAEILDLAGLPRDEVEFLVLGTTLATNAVLEGKWARTGHDHDGGLSRRARARAPAPSALFQSRYLEAMPPASRDCRIEVAGRIAPDGSESRRRSTKMDVRDAVAVLREKKVEAMAVCMLHCLRQSRARARARAISSRAAGRTSICARRPTCCPNSASSSALRRRQSTRA